MYGVTYWCPYCQAYYVHTPMYRSDHQTGVPFASTDHSDESTAHWSSPAVTEYAKSFETLIDP